MSQKRKKENSVCWKSVDTMTPVNCFATLEKRELPFIFLQTAAKVWGWRWGCYWAMRNEIQVDVILVYEIHLMILHRTKCRASIWSVDRLVNEMFFETWALLSWLEFWSNLLLDTHPNDFLLAMLRVAYRLRWNIVCPPWNLYSLCAVSRPQQQVSDGSNDHGGKEMFARFI